VIYASRPGHRVTAVLYLPEGEPPWPAALVSCGHSRSAKAAGYNQRMCILLARHGIAAFCYDPIGQGERSQILGPDGQPKHRSTTTEHFLVGIGSILVGTNTAQYRIWDGIRGIDYLASRPDIDAERIGMTGCSGGGTLTSYVMALDDRVACAVPACYITTFRRLVETIGPQDAEQNIFGQIAFGMDQPDYLLMRAPRPTLICSTTGDFFDIAGTWDAYRQAKRFYGRLGFPERVDLAEFDGPHGIPKPGRAAMVHWMRRWLAGTDEPVAEADAPVWSE
jgi:dienelactone hydrolase